MNCDKNWVFEEIRESENWGFEEERGLPLAFGFSTLSGLEETERVLKNTNNKGAASS